MEREKYQSGWMRRASRAQQPLAAIGAHLPGAAEQGGCNTHCRCMSSRPCHGEGKGEPAVGCATVSKSGEVCWRRAATCWACWSLRSSCKVVPRPWCAWEWGRSLSSTRQQQLHSFSKHVSSDSSAGQGRDGSSAAQPQAQVGPAEDVLVRHLEG